MRGRRPRADSEAAGKRDPVPRAAALGLLAALVGWVALHRWQFVASTPFPLGIDGYFYPLQVRSLLETGSLYYPSAPLATWLMAPFALLGGEVWAVKLVATAASVIVAIPIYGIARELAADRGPSVLAAVVIATAPASFYLSTEFVKNGVGIAVFAAALWAILRAHRLGRRRDLAVAALLVVAAWLTHKAAFALVLVAIGGALPLWLFASPRPRLRLLALASIAALALAIALLAPSRFLGLGDAMLFDGLFGGDLDFSLPVLQHRSGQRYLFGHEVLISFFAAVGFWLLAWRRGVERRSARVVFGFTVLAVVQAIPCISVIDPNALGFRLRLLAHVGLAVVVAPLLMLALKPRSPVTRAAVALAICGFVVSIRPTTYTEPVVLQHPSLVAAVRAAADLVPEGDGIVTPKRRLVFMATWFTRRAAARNQNAFAPQRTWRLIPLPTMSPALRRAITAEESAEPTETTIHSLHADDPLGLVLMPEKSWQRVLHRLDESQRRHYAAWPTDNQ